MFRVKARESTTSQLGEELVPTPFSIALYRSPTGFADPRIDETVPHPSSVFLLDGWEGRDAEDLTHFQSLTILFLFRG
jgi:hypothetical protein